MKIHLVFTLLLYAFNSISIADNAKISPSLLSQMNDFRATSGGTDSDDKFLIEVMIGEKEALSTLKNELSSPEKMKNRSEKISIKQKNIIKELEDMQGLEDISMYHSLYGFSAKANIEAIRVLSEIGDVSFIEEMPVFQSTFSESHPLTSTDIAHSLGWTGKGVTIAIIDDAIDHDHPAFGGHSSFPNDKIIGGTDVTNNDNDPRTICDEQAHGTSVAGIISGKGGGMTGVAPDSKFVFVATQRHSRCTDPDDSSYFNISSAIDWVIQNKFKYNIKAINMSFSFGGVVFDSACIFDNTTSGLRRSISDMLTAAHAANIILVGSAGNDGQSNGVTFPSCHPNVISVGAVYDDFIGSRRWAVIGGTCFDDSTTADQIQCNSNSGNILDIFAPADDATSPAAGGGLQSFNSTSAAAPFVAGVIATLLEKAPQLGIAEVTNAVINSGDSITVRDNLVKPRINHANALNSVNIDTPPSGQFVPLSPSGTINTNQPTFIWTAKSTVTNGETYAVRARDADGVLQVWNAITAIQAGCGSGAGTCSYIHSGTAFAEGSGGYWKVRDNESNFSSTLNFTIDTGNNPPLSGEFTPLSPSGTINTNQPTFTWTAKSTVTNGETYAVRARDAAGIVQVWNAVTAIQAGCGSGAGTCSYTHSTAVFAEGSGGYWKVRDNESNFSSTLNFTIDTGSNPPTGQIVDACQQGQTPVGNDQLFADTAVCLQNVGNGGQHQMHFFVETDKVGSTLEIILSHGAGNGTLLHKHGGRPSGTIFDHISNNSGNEEKILVENVQAQWNYIHVQAETEYSGATLLVRYQ